MDAQGLGRTHPLTPTRRLKQHTHAYNPQRAQIWRTLLQTLPPLIWALAALINVLLGR